MGNCTGYCTGCKEDGLTRFDNNQVKNSYKDGDYINGDGFGGERYSNGSQGMFSNNGAVTKGTKSKQNR